MHHTVIEFAARVLTPEAVAGRRCIEVGSYDVNGSLRPTVEALGPSSYVGTDMRPGPGVDLVCAAELLPARYGREAFDLVLCAEMLEHAYHWRAAVDALKALVAPGGHLLLTARSHGFPLHDFPADHWRFEVADFAAIFADFEVVDLGPDPHPWAPGAFLYARKPAAMIGAVDLGAIEVRSMQSEASRLHPGPT